MRKKDYELIARPFSIANKYIGLHEATIAELAKAMSEVLAIENPKFDRTKFLQACGIEEAWPGQHNGISAMAGDTYEPEN